MKTRLHIIAACADKKRLGPPPGHRLRAHQSTPKMGRLQSFINALEAAEGQAIPAVELYLGPYWATVRDLPAVASDLGFDATLWVASAGYGLIPATARIHPYSATFQVGGPDSVASGQGEHSIREQVSAWWMGLATWKGPARKAPRRVAQLAAAEPKATVLVLGSPRYIQAMESDLAAAALILPTRLSIITSNPTAMDSKLAPLLVPSEAALLPLVGGSLPSLHARVARHMIQGSRTHALRTPDLQERYQQLIAQSTYRGMPQRDDATDAEVMSFVRGALKTTPHLAFTPALRMWRDGGRACEQKRFKRIFQEVASRHVQ